MPKSDGACRLCLRDRVLVESHIFPRSLVLEMSGDDKILTRVPRNPAGTPKRRQTGPYDRFLCKECEAEVFGPWDSYGVDFLRRRNVRGRSLTAPNKDLEAVEILDADYARLKLFVISMLWRAAACRSQEFASVSLGPWEKALRDHIRLNNPGDVDDFSVHLERTTNAPFQVVMPWVQNRAKEANLRFYDAFFYGHLFHVKVDRRIVQGTMRSFLLAPQRPLILPVVDFAKSSIAKRVDRFISLREMVRQ